MKNNKFNNVFSNDPLGLLNIKPVEVQQNHTDSEQRLIESFEEINSFYEENSREPQSSSDIGEFMLAARLQGIRSNPEKVKLLLPFDFYNLLKSEESKSITVEDIIGDDPLNLLVGNDDVDDIFSLTHVRKSDRIHPDYISRRTVCKNFDEYKALFDGIHNDLKIGKRKLVEYHPSDLTPGKFYVLRGVLLFFEESNYELKEFSFDSGNRIRYDGRTKCIFDNGTESDMLYRSLDKALQKDGFGVSDVIVNSYESVEISSEDRQYGYIYVLTSLSPDPKIRSMRNLHKIGYCSGDITYRIKNAKNEPTYLMSDVRVDLAVRCFNLNVQKLESTIHSFFKDVNVAFEVYDSEGNKHFPKEWFIAPLPVIEEVIQLIVNDKIDKYRYDATFQQLVLL
jgi:hypothetical protein